MDFRPFSKVLAWAIWHAQVRHSALNPEPFRAGETSPLDDFKAARAYAPKSFSVARWVASVESPHGLVVWLMIKLDYCPPGSPAEVKRARRASRIAYIEGGEWIADTWGEDLDFPPNVEAL